MASSKREAGRGNRHVLIIGAGLHGLATAKAMLHDSGLFFDSVTIFEKDTGLGGVWSLGHIYEGLTTNSPLLTYELPGFEYPAHIRAAGNHVSAQDVNSYLESYARQFCITNVIQFQTRVDKIEWEQKSSVWVVSGVSPAGKFQRQFGYVVVCTGLYHTGNIPLSASQTSGYTGKVFHSSEIGSPEAQRVLASSERVVVSGAGKSAIDLATLLAKGTWAKKNVPVTLVYRRPHWLSPRKMIRGLIPFEKLLFCRFVNAWQPFAKYPDFFHWLIAETRFGKSSTNLLFHVIANDFIKSLNQQDLPQTIPTHPFSEALSGALHVEPPGFLDCVKDGRIKIVQGTIDHLEGRNILVKMEGGGAEKIEADNVLLATGYKVALPFFSPDTLRDLGIIDKHDSVTDTTDLPYIKLHRLIAPPKTIHRFGDTGPARNIAFNGFAYSLLNPTVAHVTGQWIVDYFTGAVKAPNQEVIEQGIFPQTPLTPPTSLTVLSSEIDHFHSWQTKTFGLHGAKGVHIGPHATLYTDLLLDDMGLQTGHAKGIPSPIRWAREWFRPMFPAIYANLAAERKARDEGKANHSSVRPTVLDCLEVARLVAVIFSVVLFLTKALGILLTADFI